MNKFPTSQELENGEQLSSKEETFSKQKGAAILIDGNNFYKNLENLGFFDLKDFFFDKFINFIAENKPIIFSQFYKGRIIREIGNVKSSRMYSEQQSLFSRLERQNIKVEPGQMIKVPEYKKCEGVYLIDQLIKDDKELKEIGDKILNYHKTCYRPIILLTQDFSYFKNFKKEGELEFLKGMYMIAHKWKEKGVDVKIAIDMIALAFDEQCELIILVSSDSDLLPAVKMAQQQGKTIKYVGFGEEGCYYSTALLNKCKKKILLTKEDIKVFFPQTLI